MGIAGIARSYRSAFRPLRERDCSAGACPRGCFTFFARAVRATRNFRPCGNRALGRAPTGGNSNLHAQSQARLLVGIAGMARSYRNVSRPVWERDCSAGACPGGCFTFFARAVRATQNFRLVGIARWGALLQVATLIFTHKARQGSWWESRAWPAPTGGNSDLHAQSQARLLVGIAGMARSYRWHPGRLGEAPVGARPSARFPRFHNGQARTTTSFAP